MAEASAELTVTPKQLGKHLRTVRRKKGLSLSEVARGAGLSRRELVSYERGKLPIPESDLWVLAGSCGVDVGELVPSTSSMELVVAADATTVGDTVTQLRRHQEDAGLAPYLHTLQKLQALPPGKRIPIKERELQTIADALGGTPAKIDERLQQVLDVSPDEASRIRAMLLAPPGGRKPKALAASSPTVEAIIAPALPEEPVFSEPAQTLPVAPASFLDAPLDAPIDSANGHNVDVFEELARLPEPVPLGDPHAPVPDLLAPQDPFAVAPFVGAPAGPPEGTVELVEGAVPVAASFGAAGAAGAADAPPIDVALRQGSDTWDWGEAPLTPRSEPEPGANSWDSTPWQPPAPPEGTPDTPVGFWEGTDDWTPAEEPVAETETGLVETELVETATPADDSWSTSPWDDTPWAAESVEPVADVNPWTADEWPRELSEEGPWDHQPDPEAVNTGFYVDWGTPDTETPPAWEATGEADPPAPVEEWQSEPAWVPVEAVAVAENGLAPINWRADGPAALPAAEADEPYDTPVYDTPVYDTPVFDTPAYETPVYDTPVYEAPVYETPVFDTPYETTTSDAATLVEAEPELAPEPEPESEPEMLSFTTAGPDWQLGNALPLVEVRGQGALVMRRADERWALADLTTATDFVLEVDVDFRSGPGLGVLFRASVDDDGRMSGYSFDIDPIYDGGGYLVRQWHADRELWNPIARVASGDPTSMHGSLTVRLVGTGDHLAALVNGVEVLNVESLKQASADRGREAATGDRVGVQAWSSSDLVINTLRVAEH